MRAFTDRPYQFFPARFRPARASVLRWFNRFWYLPCRKRIERVEVFGDAALRAQLRRDDRVLFLPNHATHADGPIAVEALRRLGRPSALMAAYDVFLRGRVTAWYMQTLGAFSVDRECCDRRALTEADAILTQGRLGLTVFPEGHVFLQNDLVMPFAEGAAFIAHAAARKLGTKARVVVVPVAIKATYAKDVRAAVVQRLRALAAELGVELAPEMTPRDALRAIGVGALDEHLAHWGVERLDGRPLPEIIRHAAESVLAKVHAERGEEVDPGVALEDRIRHLRRAAHDVLTDPGQTERHETARRWADRAMLAWRISSYAGTYVARRPTVDRIAETLEKLDEDHRNRFVPPLARRRVLVQFGEAIPLPTEPGPGRLRTRARELTRQVEALVQSGLDDLNARNTHPGGTLWSKPLG